MNIDVSDERIAECLSPLGQELIILPTEQCNFRCIYCYEARMGVSSRKASRPHVTLLVALEAIVPNRALRPSAPL